MPGRLILLEKAGKTAYLKNRFFAPNFHQTQKYEKVCIFFLSAFNGRFGDIWVWGSDRSRLGAVDHFRAENFVIFSYFRSSFFKMKPYKSEKMASSF